VNKLYALQILRGLAAWLVVFHHYVQLFYDFKSDTWMGYFFHVRGSFGVDIFFILSGFIMFLITKNNAVTAYSFFMRRVIRVMPAYWLYTSILIIFSLLFPVEFSFTDFNDSSLFKSYLLIPSENPSGIGVIPFLTVGWTLIYEVVFYTVLAVSIFMNKKYGVLICFLLITLIPFIYPEDNVYSYILGEFKIYQFLVGIVIGMFFKSNYYNKIENNRTASIYFCSMFFLGSLLVLSGIVGYGLFHKTVAAGFIVLFFILIDGKIDYSNRAVMFLVRQGDYSYSIYLSHILVIGVLLYFFGSEFNLIQELGVVSFLIIFVYLISTLSYKYIENGWVTGFLKRILLK